MDEAATVAFRGEGVVTKAGHCAEPKVQAGGGSGGLPLENFEKLVLSFRICDWVYLLCILSER